ncbi:hypothetical protein RCF45_02740, partial [Staphylococcus aureus]|nr:hypothetical protein [Staphylococcus aureus]
MALIVSRAILFLILALAFGIATVFPEQKLPLYIVFTLFVAVAIVLMCKPYIRNDRNCYK